jgi:hypothetical protein
MNEKSADIDQTIDGLISHAEKLIRELNLTVDSMKTALQATKSAQKETP